jgi:AGZA family xanthine/uracil permease-like MFS transporter
MKRYQWASLGDVNAFFGLMLDNVAVMIILFSIITLTGAIHFTPEFVVTHMIPGTALGVLLGDLVYSWMAFRLAQRTGRPDVTAMPLGLDTPSTFGVALLILMPALKDASDTLHDHERAMRFAWHVGLTVLVLVGVFKIVCALFGNLIRRLVPRAGLLGSLAAIALALIAFLPLLLDGIAAVPMVGLASLFVILLTLIAHRELPFKFPGALAAVLVGVVLYWGGVFVDHHHGTSFVPVPDANAFRLQQWQPMSFLGFYTEDGQWWAAVFRVALAKLPIALPFALATIVGGIDCTESAASAGDEYDTRAILLTEGAVSLVAGLLGGVLQTTPYIGHPAYKKMGGRAAYTLATALFIGVAGYFGWFTLLFALLPKAAMFPILVFVGVEITAASFHVTPSKHYAALAFAMLPALAYLLKVPLDMVTTLRPPHLAEGATLGLATIPLDNAITPTSAPHVLDMVQTMRCLANGFIVTSLLWGAGLAMMIDGRLRSAAVFFGVAGLCAFFGVIHSPLPSEQIGLPWEVLQLLRDTAPDYAAAVRYQTPYHWSAAYGLVVLMLLVTSLFPEHARPDPTKLQHANS